MRSGLRFLAACGVIGLSLNTSIADDYSEYDSALRPSTAPRTVHSVLREESAVEQESATAPEGTRSKTLGALEDEYGRSSTGQPAPRPTRQPQKLTASNRAKTPATNALAGVKNYHEELFGPQSTSAPKAQATARATQRITVRDPNVATAAAEDEKANLVHAEYERSRTAKRSGEIRQVQAHDDIDVNNAGPHATPKAEFDHGTAPAEESHALPTEESHALPGPSPFDPPSTTSTREEAEPAPASRVKIIQSTRPPVQAETTAPSFEPMPETHIPAPALPQTYAIEPKIEHKAVEHKAAESTYQPSHETTHEATPTAQSPSVTARWVKQGEIRVGHECSLALVVKNNSETVANNLEIDAFFPPTIRLTSAQPQPSTATDHLSWAMASLQPGEEQTIQIKLIPSKRGDLETSANVRFTGAAAGMFQVEEPMLAIEVKGPEEVMAGDLASQTVIVSNPGTGLATNIVIECRVPEGLEHPRGERLMMEIGALAPGETRMVRLPLAAVKGGKQSVSIECRADADLAQSVTREINVIAPSMKIALDGPAMRYIGRAADYSLTVTNDGAAATNNVRVMYKLPQGFKFIRADKGGTCDATQNVVSWFVGRLEAGESSGLKVALAATEPGSFAHQVSAVSEQGARATAELQTQVEGTASLVLEIVDMDDPIEVGAETAYEVRVRNEGTAAAKNVGVSCELPTAIEMKGAKGPVEHIVESGVIVFKSLDKLEAGKTALYRINVVGKTPGNHRFRARLVSDSNEEPLIFEELTKFYGDPIPGSEKAAAPATAFRR